MAAKKQLTGTNQFIQLLGKIKSADKKQVDAQFEIARMLWVIKESKLYEPQYTDMKMMVQCELDFAPSCALAYISFYENMKRLNYSDVQLKEIMVKGKFTWRQVQFCIRSAKKSLGVQAMKRYLKENYHDRDQQFNFNVQSAEAAKRVEKNLKHFGLKKSKDGRRSNSSAALLAMIEDYERLKVLESNMPKMPGKKRKLAAVS